VICASRSCRPTGCRQPRTRASSWATAPRSLSHAALVVNKAASRGRGLPACRIRQLTSDTHSATVDFSRPDKSTCERSADRQPRRCFERVSYGQGAPRGGSRSRRLSATVLLAIAPGGFASVDVVIRLGNAEVPGRRRLHPTTGARTMSMTRVIRVPALGLSGWAIVDTTPALDLGSDMLGEPSVWWHK
jgi:hypothetical protein